MDQTDTSERLRVVREGLGGRVDRSGIHLLIGPVRTDGEGPTTLCMASRRPNGGAATGQWWPVRWLSEAHWDPASLEGTADSMVRDPDSGMLPDGASLVGPLSDEDVRLLTQEELTWGDLADMIPPEALAVSVVVPAVIAPTVVGRSRWSVSVARPVMVAWTDRDGLGRGLLQLGY